MGYKGIQCLVSWACGCSLVKCMCGGIAGTMLRLFGLGRCHPPLPVVVATLAVLRFLPASSSCSAGSSSSSTYLRPVQSIWKFTLGVIQCGAYFIKNLLGLCNPWLLLQQALKAWSSRQPQSLDKSLLSADITKRHHAVCVHKIQQKNLCF